MTADVPLPSALPAALAGRLVHDVMGHLSGIVSGLDLLNDPTARAMHADALTLATASVRSLHDDMAYSRMLYGVGAGTMEIGALESMTKSLFAGRRATLDWSPSVTPLSAIAGRTLLGFVRLAAEALFAGGVATVTAAAAPTGLVVRVVAAGPRVRFPEETLLGLAGRPQDGGLAGKWAPAFHLWAAATAAGGSVSITKTDLGVTLETRFPV